MNSSENLQLVGKIADLDTAYCVHPKPLLPLINEFKAAELCPIDCDENEQLSGVIWLTCLALCQSNGSTF